jgi:putative FmdB family regulatory protein
MPIYAYRCDACGHEQDTLQKLSDPVLRVCPACHAESYRRQLTAAGFQLKGTGWYVTDFRDNGNAKGAKSKTGDAGATEGAAASGATGQESAPGAAAGSNASAPAKDGAGAASAPQSSPSSNASAGATATASASSAGAAKSASPATSS